MSDTVKVRLQIRATEGDAGDEVEVRADRAKVLMRGGAARPMTAADAKAAGVDAEQHVPVSQDKATSSSSSTRSSSSSSSSSG